MARIDRRSFVASLPVTAALPQRTKAQSDAPLLPFLELDHVSLRVSNVERSARFYMRVFGADASRDPSRQANPGSQPGELYFIRCGRSHIALAPLSGNERPGIDHFCLSVVRFDRDAARATLSSFDQPYPDWPSNNVWLKDPDGMLIQLAPSANDPQLAAIVRNAVAVSRPIDIPDTPPYRAIRISCLAIASHRRASATDYYRRLLGAGSVSGAQSAFQVGPSRLIITEGGTERFRVAVTSFDPVATRRALSSLSVTTHIGPDPSLLTLRDPDGLTFEVAGEPLL